MITIRDILISDIYYLIVISIMKVINNHNCNSRNDYDYSNCNFKDSIITITVILYIKYTLFKYNNY